MIVVIPARYASTRLPGKPLLDVAIWAKTDTQGRAYLSGNLQEVQAVPAPRQDAEPEQV